MLIKFHDRKPGNHTEICQGKMDLVPREGEIVVIDDIARIVHSVTWNVTEMSVTVLLRS